MLAKGTQPTRDAVRAMAAVWRETQPQARPQLPTQDSKEWFRLWRGLAIGLEASGVETTTPTGKRRAVTSDFMLMHVDGQGAAGFKHYNTRNYVYLRANGSLYVPRTDQAFNRGEF